MTSYIYYLYQITNLVNNKIYIGVHKQSLAKKDYYMGSGTFLKRIKPRNIEEYESHLIWITDGVSNLKHLNFLPLPFGYKRGKTKVEKLGKRITEREGYSL